MTTHSKRSFLKQKFLEGAFVKDAQKGYIVAESFNLAIDPDILQFASRCWAEHYHNDALDAIVGLPDAGARLVSVLAEMLRAPAILPSKRAAVVPGAWKNVVSYGNRSFTTNQDEVKSHIGFVAPGSRVLLVDDVVAHGNTAVAAIKALQAQGVEVVGLAVLFDKGRQEGRTRVEQETGVEVFSLITIKEITPTGEIELAEE
jgi:adenine/guanine phosphoribosyltransferase-like PRPP-binding protein